MGLQLLISSIQSTVNFNPMGCVRTIARALSRSRSFKATIAGARTIFPVRSKTPWTVTSNAPASDLSGVAQPMTASMDITY